MWFNGRRRKNDERRGCTHPRLSARSRQVEQEDRDPVEDAGDGAEHDHRSGHQKHLGCHAGDESLWLCQDRHTVFSEFFQLPPKWGALIVLACRYKFKPARSTHIYLNLS